MRAAAFASSRCSTPARRSACSCWGSGDPAELDAEKFRVLGAMLAKQARGYEAARIAWELAETGPVAAADAASAAAEGAIMAAYRFDRYRAADPDEPKGPDLEHVTLAVAEAETLTPVLRAARIGAEAANRARELQNLPAQRRHAQLPGRPGARAGGPVRDDQRPRSSAATRSSRGASAGSPRSPPAASRSRS